MQRSRRYYHVVADGLLTIFITDFESIRFLTQKVSKLQDVS